ncbi:sulfatase [Bryobacter aggregatus]|uniref:sulfatase family protein n=1 Tax=Bryobacter aggregatus TaxID=360054 RepID=UPI0004E19753|nr:sulfatase [Bryobacter aggregatus]
MNRRDFLGASAAGGAAFAQQAPQVRRTPEAVSNEKPNIIWVFGDQHRAQALSCAGDPNARTPNIDNLAELGVTFTNAVAGYPLCCPFRGSLLSGVYPHKAVPGHEYAMPDGQKTVAHAFNDAGYRTAYFGKWHVGGWHERDGRAAMFITDPAKRGGFETWSGYENNNSQWDSWVHGGQGKDAFHYRLPGFETDALSDLMIQYIKERGQEQKQARAKGGTAKPFFAALSVQPPHDPYVAPEEFLTRYNPRQLHMRDNVPNIPRVQEKARREAAGYYAMIENLDHNFGRIRKALEESGLGFNTHIVFFSDHGDMHGSQGMFRKTNPFEESIRIPFIIGGEIPRYEGRKNGRFPAVLNHVDIAPTTLGLCGIKKPDWMQGSDLSHHRLNKPAAGPEPDSAYLQLVIPTGHPDSINAAYRGLVTKDGWKYTCFENRGWLMFNLNEDPLEQANLAQNNLYRAERKKLIARLKQWVNDTGDKFDVPAE